MMRRILSLLLVAVPLAAQTPQDSTHVRAQRARLDSARVAMDSLRRWCNVNSYQSPRYLRRVCGIAQARPDVRARAAEDSLLLPPVTPSSVNQAPTASFTVSCIESTCTFDGRASTDDKGIASWSWRATGKPTLTGAVVTRPWTSGDSGWAETVTVTDSAGLSASAMRQVFGPPITPTPEPTPTPVPPSGNVELPRVVPAYRDPYPGRSCSVSVASGGDITAALSAARSGAVVCLTAGGTYGPVTLPTRAAGDTGWIVLRTAGTLPPEGERMRPSAANNLAKIHIATNAQCAIATAPRATGYYIRGIEVRAAASVTLTYDFVCLKLPDVGTFTVADEPSRIVLAQLYVHGHGTHQIQNCIKADPAHTAIVDSWISECHMRGVESHGIATYASPGPLLIENNFVEAQSINVLVGGATPRHNSGSAPLTGRRTSDITVRRNHFFTPPAWQGVWTPRKNHVEFKNAARILVEANVLDGSWEEASHGGVAFVLKSINDEGTCTWCLTSDVTLRKNLVVNVGMAVTISGSECYASTGCANAFPPNATRLAILDNVFALKNIAPGAPAYYGRGFQLGGGATDIQFERNVLAGEVTGVMLMVFRDRPLDRVTFRDNVWSLGGQALHIDPGGGVLRDGITTYVWERMTLFGSVHAGGLPSSTIVASESQAPLAAQIRSLVSSAVSGVVIQP